MKIKRERENRLQSKHHALRELEQWRYKEKILSGDLTNGERDILVKKQEVDAEGLQERINYQIFFKLFNRL